MSQARPLSNFLMSNIVFLLKHVAFVSKGCNHSRVAKAINPWGQAHAFCIQQVLDIGWSDLRHLSSHLSLLCCTAQFQVASSGLLRAYLALAGMRFKLCNHHEPRLGRHLSRGGTRPSYNEAAGHTKHCTLTTRLCHSQHGRSAESSSRQ